MTEGTVKFFNLKSHFGFIIDAETGKEYYVHEKDLLETVKEGDVVQFETKLLKRGTVAIKVKKKDNT